MLPPRPEARSARVEDELAAAKRRLREVVAGERRAVTRQQAQAAGRALEQLLEACAAWTSAPRLALYAALPDEIPTRELFERVREEGKEVLLPRVDAARGLVFHRIEHWGELRPGVLRVSEPPAEAPEAFPGPGEPVLVPGVAFDRAGHRLGRGRGYYDAAFPPGPESPLLLGVGFGFQLRANVPHGSRDRRVDAIVTERGIHWVTRRSA